MPRLIDADALKEAMNYNGGCGICFRYIDNADTIPAIPVEWLEEHDSKGNEYMRWYITVAEALSMWQKEQEAR